MRTAGTAVGKGSLQAQGDGQGTPGLPGPDDSLPCPLRRVWRQSIPTVSAPDPIASGELAVDSNSSPCILSQAADLLWVWTRTLLEGRVLPHLDQRPVTVDFALEVIPDDEPESSASRAPRRRDGEVAQLDLEVIDGGVDQVILHPGVAMSNWPDESFQEAVCLGWNAARGHIKAQAAARKDRNEAEPTLCYGRYRISSRVGDGEKVPFREPIKGGSAGGAAFRGWWHALQGKIPDSELIVLATLEKPGSEYQLGQVDGLEGKIEAIVRLGRHDTIAVANAADKRAVDLILERIAPRDRPVPRVVDLSRPDPDAPPSN